MQRGPWHQFGDRSQKMAIEQLQHKCGVGVIISPRDLAFNKAVEYSHDYHELGAHVLIDQQFYRPQFRNKNFASYPINDYRLEVSELKKISNTKFNEFANQLRLINSDISADGIIAPAIVYEAGRLDIVELNHHLFNISKQVGNDLGVPTYATIFLGRSATTSTDLMNSVLSSATACDCDGWYFGFEFEDVRIPFEFDSLLRFCQAGLTLSTTGKSVLHAYSGPMSLLSLSFGATGVGIGHSQNMWKFTPNRWQQGTAQGGGGDAPPRYFSKNLWGTIIYPDEISQLSQELRHDIIFNSLFSQVISPTAPFLAWSRWDANKHLINIISKEVSRIAQTINPRANAKEVLNLLQTSIDLHSRISSSGINLSDNTNVYQNTWYNVIEHLLKNHSADYDYLDLIYL